MESNCPLCGHQILSEEGIHIEPDTGFVVLDGKVLKLPNKTMQVLSVLIDKSPRIVSRAFIMDALYGLYSSDEEPAEKIIDIFISRVRHEIKSSNYEVLTIWGKGWIFRRKISYSQELKVEAHNGREEHQREAV